MNKKITLIYILGMLLFGLGYIQADNKESVDDALYESSYTSIAEKDCRTLESDNLGSIEECESFADMKVTVIEGDLKQGITLTRDGKNYELNFRNAISYTFMSFGLELEWRYKHNQFDNPIALITRLDINDDPEDIEKVSSYLVVSKITEDEICIVGKVDAQKDQNKRARDMAEKSDRMACLETINLN
jgi:hypothetical protein